MRTSYFDSFLRPDGTVVCVGNNHYGQCTPPKSLSDVVYVASGNSHCSAMRSDGTVVCWGDNRQGQLDIPDRLNNVVKICVGLFHTVALCKDGSVYCWGGEGDLHNFSICPKTQEILNPSACSERVHTHSMTNVVDIAAGDFHTVFLNKDSTTSIFGYNLNGCCDLSGCNPTGIVKIIAMRHYTVLLMANGRVVVNNVQSCIPSLVDIVDIQKQDSGSSNFYKFYLKNECTSAESASGILFAINTSGSVSLFYLSRDSSASIVDLKNMNSGIGVSYIPFELTDKNWLQFVLDYGHIRGTLKLVPNRIKKLPKYKTTRMLSTMAVNR